MQELVVRDIESGEISQYNYADPTFAATPLLRAVPAPDDLALDEDARRRAKAVQRARELGFIR